MYYYSFNRYLRERFGARVHRLSINAGFDCPNRDGTLGKEGCIFCNEKGFSRFSENAPPLSKQITESMDFCRKRFKANKFIAYFQNATNTHADVRTLKKAYDVINDFPDIVGLFISTRPDCIDDEKLDLIESYASRYEVWIEYGLQSVNDSTLELINRLHTFSDFLKAVHHTARRNIKIGTHVILGLPQETREDMLETARTISHLPIAGVKLHVLHVLRDTKLERLYEKGEVRLLEKSEYVATACDFLEALKPNCVVFRLLSDAVPGELVAPAWINEKQSVTEDINKEFEKRGTRQGCRHGKKSLRVR